MFTNPHPAHGAPVAATTVRNYFLPSPRILRERQESVLKRRSNPLAMTSEKSPLHTFYADVTNIHLLKLDGARATHIRTPTSSSPCVSTFLIRTIGLQACGGRFGVSFHFRFRLPDENEKRWRLSIMRWWGVLKGALRFDFDELVSTRNGGVRGSVIFELLSKK